MITVIDLRRGVRLPNLPPPSSYPPLFVGNAMMSLSLNIAFSDVTDLYLTTESPLVTLAGFPRLIMSTDTDGIVSMGC